MKNQNAKEPKPVKRYKKSLIRLINIALPIVLALSIACTAGCAALLYMDFSDSGDAAADLNEITKSQDEDVVYFLIAGMDEGEHLTDIMMVVCFNKKAGTANILQIPRDTFIGADVATGKMNAVYGTAPREEGQTNINVMLRRINDFLGLPIDHYITVSLTAFRAIVDSVGGVDVYVPNSIPDAFNEARQHYSFKQGWNHFNGSMAEAFVRHRHSYSMGDLGRVKAQRSFYSAFIKKCLGMSYGQMASAATKIYDKVSTDMRLVDLLAYAKEAQQLETSDIVFYAVPGQSGTYSINGKAARSYYSIHKQDYVDMINAHFLAQDATPLTVDQLLIEELHDKYYRSYLEEGTLNSYILEEDKTSSSATSSAASK